MGYIIDKQEAAKTSEAINLTKGPFPKTVFVAGLLVDEEIPVYVVDVLDSEADPLPLYDTDGEAVVLSVSSPPLTIPSPIHLKFAKPLTDNEVGIVLQEITV